MSEPVKKKIKKEKEPAAVAVKMEPPATPQIKLEPGGGLKSSAANAARAQSTWMKSESEKVVAATARQKPVKAYLLQVLEHLKKTRNAETAAEIKAATNNEVDIDANKELLELLKNNIKIKYEDGRFSYKSRHTVLNKDDIVRLLARNPDGIPIEELEDAYPNVEKDIDELLQIREIFGILNAETKKKTLYFSNYLEYKNVMEIDIDIRSLWNDVKYKMPPAIDLDKEMKLAKLSLMKQDEAVVDGKKKKQRKKRERKIKLTNTHLSEIGIDLSKDYVPAGPSGASGSISVQSVPKR
eukprot:tig00000178_g12733.t1